MWDTVSRERNEGQQPEPGCCFLLLFGPKEAEGVGALPVLPYLEVEVVSGRIPGGAYIANHFALLDLLACHHTDGGTVGIQGFVSEERRESYYQDQQPFSQSRGNKRHKQ